jgi:sugar/nucleoside kinase (ribokinase family)
MGRPKFVSIGAAVQDVFLSHSDALNSVKEEDGSSYAELKMGGKADVDQVNFSTGGGATNAAVTFARQGYHSVFMGAIGNDPAGQAVKEDLGREGVEAHLTCSKQHNTGYSVILLANSGERTILTYRGASTHYESTHFNLAQLGHIDWLYMSNLAGATDILEKLFYQANKLGIKIGWNPGKAELSKPERLKHLLSYVEVLIVNKQEMQNIVPGEKLEDLVRAGNKLVPVVVVSDGSNGVAATDGKTYVRAGMYEDVPVLDRTGAGDAFGSGFVCEWAHGASLKEAVIFASANSTSVVSKIGAKAGILKANAKIHDMEMEEKSYEQQQPAHAVSGRYHHRRFY